MVLFHGRILCALFSTLKSGSPSASIDNLARKSLHTYSIRLLASSMLAMTELTVLSVISTT